MPVLWRFVLNRPRGNASNAAMIYAVGPHADQAKTAEDFVTAVRDWEEPFPCSSAIQRANGQSHANRVCYGLPSESLDV